MADSMGNCCTSLEEKDVPQYPDWMGQLPEKLHNVPLNQLAIPGSHDSTSFYLNEKEPLGPDADSALKEVCKYLPEARKIIYNWSKAQSLNYTQQMEAGIRYFDVRVSTMPKSQDLFLLHGMYSYKIEDLMNCVNTFLNQHPKEVILLDLNHFYGMTTENHKWCLDLIMRIFGDKLCPYLDIDSVNLTTLWENKLQVIVFYHDKAAEENFLFWPGKMIPSPWPNTPDVSSMVKALERNFEKARDMSIFYVSQGVLTPDTGTILKHLLSTLKSVLSIEGDKAFVKWVGGKKAGKNGINVCIMDFVELYDYIPTLMKLNQSFAESL